MSRFGNLEFGDRLENQAQEKAVVPDEVLHLQEAGAALRRGDFERALRAYCRVLESNPENAQAWAGQVRMLIELGEFEEAKRWADKAAERFPHEPEVLAAKAVTLARTGDHNAALTFSDAALEEGQDTPYVWLARGDVLLARAEQRAEYCFQKALAAAPLDWLWPWLASRVHFFYRKFSLALKLVGQALALEGSQAVIWLQMGRCQLALGLAAAAEESFTQAKQLDPQSSATLLAMGASTAMTPFGRVLGRLRRWLQA